MLKDIVAAEARKNHTVFLRFEDGTEGTVDLGPVLSFNGIFAPLQDVEYFRKLFVDRELGTIVWPNGADIDPAVLYSLLTGRPLVFTPAHS